NGSINVTCASLMPIIHQQYATDCGPASLAMVGAYYKRRVSHARLREFAGTDRHGTNLAGLKTAAEHIGFNARAVRASSDALQQISLPSIAHWREHNREHFVVLYRISPQR